MFYFVALVLFLESVGILRAAIGYVVDFSLPFLVCVPIIPLLLLLQRTQLSSRTRLLRALIFVGFIPFAADVIFNAVIGTLVLLMGFFDYFNVIQEYLNANVIRNLILFVLAASLSYRLFVFESTLVAGQFHDGRRNITIPSKRSILIVASALALVPFFSYRLVYLILLPLLSDVFGQDTSLVHYAVVILVTLLCFGVLQRLLSQPASLFVFATAFISVYPTVLTMLDNIVSQVISMQHVVPTAGDALPPPDVLVPLPPPPLPPQLFLGPNFWFNLLVHRSYQFDDNNGGVEGIILPVTVSLIAAVATYLLARLFLHFQLKGDPMPLRPLGNVVGWNGTVTQERGHWPLRRRDGSSQDEDNEGTFNPVTVLLVSSAITVLSLVALALVAHGFKPIPVVIGTLLSILLASLPILVSHGQSTSRERQLQRLDSLATHPVSQTAFYRAARAALMSLQTVSLNRMYSIPLAALATILVFGFLTIFLATDAGEVFKTHSFMLGGAEGIGLEGDKLDAYQRGTFLALSMAFLGSYIYMLFSLVFRVQNNDVYPMAFYAYGVRMIISSIVAIVLRHVTSLFGGPFESSQVVVLLGFIVGFTPDLFIAVMARKAFTLVKIIGIQPDPSTGDLPTSQNLLMIEGMSRDKIDRLNELGIDSAQHLACQNPFLIWLRLPFDLSLIVDWIAQAQLYRWAKEVRIKSMRGVGINNIFDFYEFLASDNIPKPLLGAIGITADAVPYYRANLEEDPSFTRLQAVRRTMRLAGFVITDEHMSLNQHSAT